MGLELVQVPTDLLTAKKHTWAIDSLASIGETVVCSIPEIY